MGDFYKDVDGYWWFKTVGKGNKTQQIGVSHAMAKQLQKTDPDEAQSLKIATVHWLRHTGISEYVDLVA
jgi:hypothetical protein